VEYEVIIKLKIDPDSYIFELGKENNSDDVKELMENVLYDIEDVEIVECEVIRQ
jgi:hypothetical protein|tara:strand:- start:1307 stop:1468 length:162 start_codon:yes stop_codon:yes gene_type:complete